MAEFHAEADSGVLKVGRSYASNFYANRISWCKSHILVLCCLKGWGEFECGRKVFRLKVGQAVVFAASRISPKNISPRVEIGWIDMRPSAKGQEFLGFSKVESQWLASAFGKIDGCPFYFSSEMRNRFERLFQIMASEAAEGPVARRLKLKVAAMTLLVLIEEVVKSGSFRKEIRR